MLLMQLDNHNRSTTTGKRQVYHHTAGRYSIGLGYLNKEKELLIAFSSVFVENLAERSSHVSRKKERKIHLRA